LGVSGWILLGLATVAFLVLIWLYVDTVSFTSKNHPPRHKATTAIVLTVYPDVFHHPGLHVLTLQSLPAGARAMQLSRTIVPEVEFVFGRLCSAMVCSVYVAVPRYDPKLLWRRIPFCCQNVWHSSSLERTSLLLLAMLCMS
ncbi:hypothetical protein SK128_026071, partial [Halocaridina rubra]